MVVEVVSSEIKSGPKKTPEKLDLKVYTHL